MDINLRFESNNKRIEVGKGKSYRLLKIDGIESTDNELSISSNVSADGSKVSNKKIKAKSIMIEAEYTQDNKEEERRRLISFFNLHKGGRLVVKIGDIEKAIGYEIEGFNAKLVHVNNPLTFLISLYCPDPFFKEVTEIKQEVAIWRSSFCFPLEIVEGGIEMGYKEPSLIVNVFNSGDVKTGMRVKFKALATLTNPSLFNVNTREYFKILTTMESGDIITVNTNKFNKRVELNRNGVVTNIFNKIDLYSKFLQLDVGDNLLRYDSDTNIDNLEVDIYFNPQKLGV